MAKLTRRNFLAGSALAAAAAGLVACNNAAPADGGTEGGDAAPADDIYAAPDASAYPIEPDGEGVEALYETKESRSGFIIYTNPNGVEIGVANAAKMIQVNGLAFRDANGDGKLDLYEDWRQSDEDRAVSLAAQMTGEEIIPLMWHDGFTSSAVPLDEATTEKLGQGLRAGVSRANSNLNSYATDIKWVNAIQQWCEENDKFGIPYMNSTDPYQLYSIPDNHCLVSSFDPELWKKSGRYTGRAWRACGLRVNLGPQVDIGTNVVWTRLGGSICEDPAANRDVAKFFGGGMQSTWGDDACTDDKGWGKDSVAIMLKHYVGAGAVEGGRNDHNDAGKYDVFPGDNFNAHLVPFLDGGLKLESTTGKMAAVMPNYGIAYTEDESLGPIWGGAYNARNIGILRNAGWDGMVTTDWQILRPTDFGDRAHGVKDMTEGQRFKKLIDATVDQVGGDWAPEIGLEGYKLYKEANGEEAATARLQQSAAHIFTVMNHVQLFDNPYSDTEYAKTVLEDAAAAEFGQECSNKSIVMLKNKGNVLSAAGITGKPKCYIPTLLKGGSGFFDTTPKHFELAIDPELANELFTVVTETYPAEVPQDEAHEKQQTQMGPMASEPDPNAPKEYEYNAGDLVAPSAEELASCEYVVYIMASPNTGAGEPGGGMFGAAPADTPADQKYLPISLQYRPYTADTARDPSLAGDIVDGAKENRSYKGKSVTASNEGELDTLLSLREAMPNAKIILIVEGTNNAQCFHEIEPSADAILWSWASSGRAFGPAYGRILKGEVEPSALLPCQMPASMEAVEASLEDVPRDLEVYVDSEGNAYDFCFGLNWSGVIDDERTAIYKAAPLTEPETEVKPGEWSKE
ncbi:MAG: glycoside hydrolase family 3 C-terminal domain-containing protein [Atopobiaceae bacterium]|nr:glycoside hydrolase family 3 C-terminal domain-containing protein [Atopobiaceae bacterium]